MGLDKQYVTDVDLRATSSTGDPEGELSEHHPGQSREQLEAELARLRGEVELPIPAASAVKIGGERAYRLMRQGQVVEMPLRRSRVDALDVIAYTGDPNSIETVTLACAVSSGTYVRSLAAALGGHCTTLRRTAVGPFRVEEADPDRIVPAADALARLPAEALARVEPRIRESVLALEAEGT